MKKLQEYVDDINTNIEKLATRGPVSKYVLPEENLRGRFWFFLPSSSLSFYCPSQNLKKKSQLFVSCRLTLSFDEASAGVACNLDSRGFHVLCKATEEVVGHVKPYSITGTLPLIRDLKVKPLLVLSVD